MHAEYDQYYPLGDRHPMCIYLACSVNDIAIVFNAIMLDALLESRFYCRIVGFNEVVLDELNDQ